METWTWIVAGLVALPVVGLLAVVADLFDAYRDLLIVKISDAGDLEEEQAKHTLWAQAARAVVLAVIANIALFELASWLHRDLLAAFVYSIAIVGVADAWRARKARKRMIALINGTEN